VLKNVVIRILGEVKEKKKRLSIKEGVEMIMKKREEEERGHRMKLRKKIEDLYEDEAAKKKIDNSNPYKKPDKLFGRVTSLQGRVLKLMTAQSESMDSMFRKLQAISKKHQKGDDAFELDSLKH
jgi:hypothetical protein